MSYLLDTHVWLWSLLEPERLRPKTRALLKDARHRLYLSPISVWEATLLVACGRLELASDPASWFERVLVEQPILEAPLTFAIALETRAIELPHPDPADRFLAATARALDLVLLTADRRLLDCRTLETLAA